MTHFWPQGDSFQECDDSSRALSSFVQPLTKTRVPCSIADKPHPTLARLSQDEHQLAGQRLWVSVLGADKGLSCSHGYSGRPSGETAAGLPAVLCVCWWPVACLTSAVQTGCGPPDGPDGGGQQVFKLITNMEEDGPCHFSRGHRNMYDY